MPCERVNQTRLCASIAVPTPLLALDVQRGGMPGAPGALPIDIVIADRCRSNPSDQTRRFRLLRVSRARGSLEESVLLGADRLRVAVSSQRRNPPTKALAESPSRQPGGNSFSLLTLPPPSTTSSGSRAAIRRVTTSATYFRHFFLPYR